MSRWPSSAMHSVSSKQAIRMERGEIRASLSIAPGLRVASPGRRGPLVRGRRRNGVPPARERRWSERREPAASASPSRHSREGGSPLWPFSHCGPRGFAPRPQWIPAFAGMTKRQVARMERGRVRASLSIDRSRISLRSIRATGFFRPWPPPQWITALAGMTVERGATTSPLPARERGSAKLIPHPPDLA